MNDTVASPLTEWRKPGGMCGAKTSRVLPFCGPSNPEDGDARNGVWILILSRPRCDFAITLGNRLNRTRGLLGYLGDEKPEAKLSWEWIACVLFHKVVFGD